MINKRLTWALSASHLSKTHTSCRHPVTLLRPSEYQTLNHCRLNVAPESETMGKHWISIVSASSICGVNNTALINPKTTWWMMSISSLLSYVYCVIDGSKENYSIWTLTMVRQRHFSVKWKQCFVCILQTINQDKEYLFDTNNLIKGRTLPAFTRSCIWRVVSLDYNLAFSWLPGPVQQVHDVCA